MIHHGVNALRQLGECLTQSAIAIGTLRCRLAAMSMSDRIAVMRDGVIMQVGSPEDIYRHPLNRFVAEFIGDPPINILPCQVVTSGRDVRASTACHFNIALGRAEIEAGEHWLAVRPHVFKVGHEPTDGSAPVVVRFVENFGSEHVLHVEYGDRLARVVVPPGFAEHMETVHLSLDAAAVHLIDPGNESTVRLDLVGVAA